MKKYKLDDFTRGWIIGDFSPAILKTKTFEFCVKGYKSGDKEETHVHKIATEISVVVAGNFKMNNKKLNKGDVLVMKPNDIGSFSCLSDGSIAVVKIPSAKGDKYLTKADI